MAYRVSNMALFACRKCFNLAPTTRFLSKSSHAQYFVCNALLSKIEEPSIVDNALLSKTEELSILDNALLSKTEEHSILDNAQLSKTEEPSILDNDGSTLLNKTENLTIADDVSVHTEKLTIADDDVSVQTEKLTKTKASSIVDAEKSGKSSSKSPKKPRYKPLWHYIYKGSRQRKVAQLIKQAQEKNDENQHGGNVKEVQDVKEVKDMKDVVHMSDVITVFSQHDLDVNDVEHVLTISPRIFGASKSDLLLRLNQLMDIALCPQITHDQVKRLVLKCPPLLKGTSVAHIDKRLENLQRLGLKERQIYDIVLKHPQILMSLDKRVAAKVRYVVDELGANIDLFVKFPRMFTCSMTRLKERHAFLVEHGYVTKGTRMTEVRVRAIVLASDEKFIDKVTRTTPEVYHGFTKKFWAREGVRRDTARRSENAEDDEDDEDDDDDGDQLERFLEGEEQGDYDDDVVDSKTRKYAKPRN